MAKSKPKSKVVADEEALDEEAAEEEAQEEEAAEEEVPDETGDEEPPEPPPLKPKLTWTTLLFILLNWAAVPAFLYFAYLDHITRLQYSYRTVLNHIAVFGLPLKEEEDFPSASNETRPYLRLTPDQLKSAFKARKGVATVPKGEEFVPVEEPVPLRVRPSDMIPEVLENIFRGLRDEVPTLEDEIDRLKKTVPADIERAAKEKVLAKLKTDEEKRETVRKVLLPLAWDVWQVKDLEKKIAAAKDADLDALVEESVQRRMYYDILAPVNVFRPGDLGKFNVEKIADLEKNKLEQVKDALVQRLSAAGADKYNPEFHMGEVWDKEKTGPEAMKRDSIEKRQKIAFVMFTLSQVPVPTLDEKLYPKGLERAQTVCGIREFTSASIHYVRAVRILEERIVQSVAADRQGFLVALKDKQDQMTRTQGFIDEYEAEVDRLVKIVEHIDGAQKRLDDLKSQRDQFQKLFDQRTKQHKDTVEKLLTARKDTEKYVKDLRALQSQMHTALVELSDAAERNFALEARIRAIELGLLTKMKKGGKKQP